jgi:hypothetical protein
VPLVQPFDVWEDAPTAIPEAVADEAEWILNSYSPEMLWYADDVFTIHHGWTLKYAAELKRRGIRVPSNASRARPAESADRGHAWRRWVARACGSDRKADRSASWTPWSAASRVEQVQEAVDLVRTHWHPAGMFLMWGYEGEQIEDIEATVEHVKHCRPDVFLTTVSYPIKGTAITTTSRQTGAHRRMVRTPRIATGSIRGRHSRATSSSLTSFCAIRWTRLPDSAPHRSRAERVAGTLAEVEV